LSVPEKSFSPGHSILFLFQADPVAQVEPVATTAERVKPFFGCFHYLFPEVWPENPVTGGDLMEVQGCSVESMDLFISTFFMAAAAVLEVGAGLADIICSRYHLDLLSTLSSPDDFIQVLYIVRGVPLPSVEVQANKVVSSQFHLFNHPFLKFWYPDFIKPDMAYTADPMPAFFVF
jgi:hypothetical protein